MITVAILTVSDSASTGARPDASGPALRQACEEAGWVVRTTAILPDEEESISSRLRAWADSQEASLILTTGGTGVAARDVTPEATVAVFDREIPGIPELLRSRGLEQTKFAVLSRGVAGVRKESLIINLPGSPKGALQGLQVIKELVPHLVDLLHGKTGHTD
ncbi:MAG: MogA/MoaB family molybdenum cofactor biosynthesis protein [Acidobacteriaceae bacterium]|nr:MogA/MoaB family molybdenum cofactor biosynthesis protein [Acidobacteriaceae bacterium]MBV9501458.1 MogA/MoaB family molybdenum cofactor biosynthesis protein [Acidobacteriaceae bacterium]